MTSRKLPSARSCFRIGDPAGRYPIFSGDGAALVEGRWHERGQSVIYACEHYSTAMLERFAYLNGVMPPNSHFIEITLPAGTTYEVVTKDSLPEWIDSSRARRFGSRWLSEGRSAVLFVPSYVARVEQNVLINPGHGEFAKITYGLETPVWWDKRLF